MNTQLYSLLTRKLVRRRVVFIPKEVPQVSIDPPPQRQPHRPATSQDGTSPRPNFFSPSMRSVNDTPEAGDFLQNFGRCKQCFPCKTVMEHELSIQQDCKKGNLSINGCSPDKTNIRPACTLASWIFDCFATSARALGQSLHRYDVDHRRSGYH